MLPYMAWREIWKFKKNVLLKVCGLVCYQLPVVGQHKNRHDINTRMPIQFKLDNQNYNKERLSLLSFLFVADSVSFR